MISDAGTKRGMEDVTVITGIKVEMGNLASDVGTMSTIGDMTSEAGADPEMENVTCNAGTKGTTDVMSKAQLMAACTVADIHPRGDITSNLQLPTRADGVLHLSFLANLSI